MRIEYDNSNIERICTDSSYAQRKYGKLMTFKLASRLEEIETSKSIEEMIHLRIGRCHSLKGNRSGQYAVDLIHPYRLIFEKKEDKIVIANIIEIVDYH